MTSKNLDMPKLKEIRAGTKPRFKGVSQSEYDTLKPHQKQILDVYNNRYEEKTNASSPEVMHNSLSSMPDSFFKMPNQYSSQ